MNHQINLSCNTLSTVVFGDLIAAGLARFRDNGQNVYNISQRI